MKETTSAAMQPDDKRGGLEALDEPVLSTRDAVSTEVRPGVYVSERSASVFTGPRKATKDGETRVDRERLFEGQDLPQSGHERIVSAAERTER